MKLRWSRAAQQYNVQNYSVQVFNNSSNRWDIIRYIPKNSNATSYTTEITSFNNNWADNSSNYLFRISVTQTIEAFPLYYRNGNSVSVSGFCENPGNIDLEITNATIFSDCSSCPARLNDLGSRRHILGSGPITIIDVFIKNNGTAISNSTRLSIYLSIDNDFDSEEDEKIKDIPIGAIAGGNTASFGGGGAIFRNDLQEDVNGNYNILLIVDDPGNNDEGNNEDNNITVVPIELRNSFGDPNSGNCIICPIDINDSPFFSRAAVPKELYNLDIYDLTGQQIKTVKVSNVEEENNIVADLPKKIYILKTKNGTRKVY